MATATAKGGKRKGIKIAPPPVKKSKRAPKGQGKAPVAQVTFLATVKAENPTITADEFAAKFQLSVEDVFKYRGFVLEYLKDYDEKAACLRMGFPEDIAAGTGKIYLYNSYVQLRLAEFLDKAEVSEMLDAPRIIAGLIKEANAPDRVVAGCAMSSSSTRISAWKELAKIAGLSTPKPIEPEETVLRVMYLPPPVAPHDWEAGARASQKALKASVVVDV